jgi:hypothetical protein
MERISIAEAVSRAQQATPDIAYTAKEMGFDLTLYYCNQLWDHAPLYSRGWGRLERGPPQGFHFQTSGGKIFMRGGFGVLAENIEMDVTDLGLAISAMKALQSSLQSK